MQIDWFTILAQVINFLVLVWLLKRFLYVPVMQAMARREASIAERLNAAERRESEASAEAARYTELEARLKAERQTVLDQARKDMEVERNALQEQARKDVDAQRAQWQAELVREQEVLRHALRDRGARQVLGTTRHVLDQLAGASLEGRLVERFIERLGELPDGEHIPMAEALAGADEARIETSFPLEPAQRETMTAALRDTFATLPPLHFDTTERFACGIELIAGGRRLSWTLDHALGEMDEALGKALANPGGENR